MKTPGNSRSFPFRLIGTLSILSFTAGFGISFHYDAARALEVGRLAWNHLTYAIQLKDDMAVIDWSKDLEKSENILAFRVSDNSKIIAEGGNQDFLNKVDLTLPFVFPNHFYTVYASSKSSANTATLLLTYRADPGPVAWGLIALGICFVSCSLIALRLSYQPLQQGFHANGTSTNPVQPTQPKSPEPIYSKTLQSDQAFLYLDKQFVIHQINSKAAEYFGKKLDDLLNGHLFDLAPDPKLMQAIEEGLEIKNLKAFPQTPILIASLRPDPNGTLLLLEKSDGAETLKKH